MGKEWTDAERIADAQRWQEKEQAKKDRRQAREKRQKEKLAKKRAQAERARQKAEIRIIKLRSKAKVSQAKTDARRAAERKHKASSALYRARYERIGAAVSPLTGAVRRTGRGVSKVVKQVQKQQKRNKKKGNGSVTAWAKKHQDSLCDWE